MAISEIIVIFCVGVQLYGIIGLWFCYRTMKAALAAIERLNDDGTPKPKAAESILKRLRREPEPEPGGTKVYQAEPWDEGIERENV